MLSYEEIDENWTDVTIKEGNIKFKFTMCKEVNELKTIEGMIKKSITKPKSYMFDNYTSITIDKDTITFYCTTDTGSALTEVTFPKEYLARIIQEIK